MPFLPALVLAAFQQPDPVDQARWDGIHYLVDQQHTDGSWTLPGNERFSHAGAAYLGFVLLQAGLPREHVAIWRVDQLLRGRAPRSTYDAAVRVHFLDAYRPTDLEPRLERAARHLQLPRSDYFGYGYANTLAQGDLSNHQFALLALELLDRHELGPNRRQWQRLAEFLLRHQHPEGGWGYFPQQSSSPTMLWAGAACLAACQRALERAGESGKLLSRINDALQHSFQAGSANWYLDSTREKAPLHRWVHYAGATLERAASLTEQRLIGKKDWYREVSQFLVTSQHARGSWSSGKGEPVLNTGLALAALARATASTGSGPSPQPTARWISEEGPIRIVAQGTHPCVAFLSSVDPNFAGDGWEIQQADWWWNHAPLGSGEPSRGAIRFAIEANGEHLLRARFALKFAGLEGAASDVEIMEVELPILVEGLADAAEKKELSFVSNQVNFDAPELLNFEASSMVGGELAPGWAIDGSYGTSWRWKPDDEAPRWSIELPEAVRCTAIRIVPHLRPTPASELDAVAPELRLRIQGRRLRLQGDQPDAPVYYLFPRKLRVQRLELEVLHSKETPCPWLGIREIQLLTP